jgi:SAM-dependent methyltransferase
VEVQIAPPTHLPLADGAFDLVVLDETGGLLSAMREEDRAATLREALRILRGGGRIMVIASGRPSGLRGMLSPAPAGEPLDLTPALRAGGFGSVRKLAEREGLIFVEGIKPRVTA